VRLQSIKLSGFKSFAEPTHFELPGQLVGVVGPNGCGKSNIMDAVRWVLGESKASELRGESMQDVIFNGTTQRKPASRSSVELIFENSDHRAGGQWAQYAEISVKRVLTRDGNSSYYINQQPVRRRDVQDVFLGTGLGPRAYAIIGQGTISRIIESRPEELRLFLEEAAGVSKYKERRRETANRLEDTRENLTRVEDILRELNANLEKLERQAEVAQRYTALQSEATLKQQQLWVLKRNEAQSEQVKLAAQVQEAMTDLEAHTADLRRVEADLEALRQAHFAAADQLNQSQGQLYEASAEVGKLEAEIRYVVEARERIEQRRLQLQQQLEQWTQRQTEAQVHLESLEGDDASLFEQSTILQAQLEEQEATLPAFELTLSEAQGHSHRQREGVVQVQQQLQVLSAQQTHVEEQVRTYQARRDRLSQDRSTVEVPQEQAVEEAKSRLDVAQAQADDVLQQFEQLQVDVPQWDEARKLAQSELNDAQARAADLNARLEALQSLQDKLQTDDKLRPWLGKHGLEHLQPLWKRLHIESGWERALEAALKDRMGSLEVSRLESLSALAVDAPVSKLTFYSPADAASSVPSATGLRALHDLMRLHDSQLSALMAEWLQGLYACESLEQAMSMRSQLRPGEAILVPQGHSVGRYHLSFFAEDDAQAGIFARAQEIENLHKSVRAQSLLVEEARTRLMRHEQAYHQGMQQLAQLRSQSASAQSAAHQAQVEWLKLSQLAQQAQQRASQLDTDLAETDAHLEELEARRVVSQEQFENLDLELAAAQERHAELDEAVIQAQRQLDQARETLRQLERQVQEATFSQRTVAARREELQRTIQTALSQTQDLQAEAIRLDAETQNLSDVSAQAGLQAALEVKMQRESALASKRSEYEDLTHKLRALDERRLSHERDLEPRRQRIVEVQLKEQAARLGYEQWLEQLVQSGCDVAAVESSIAEQGVRLQGLSSEIDRLHREMEALGPVNLAALDELTESRERKVFLDAQSADLNEAINTLEDAIRKIDAETRELLANTFETVNEHFGRMFPELFGGGNAKLIMTGEEILDAGVQVMAQPPGKKNQTIHLLSGGEKALTAIALVFAIFQLNPAPFCLLDEVDAPLDDANTERYARLVKSMSQSTQFLFISHNKIAMEMAQQLIGVTMQEQGVSRIVAVDMESAQKMAELA